MKVSNRLKADRTTKQKARKFDELLLNYLRKPWTVHRLMKCKYNLLITQNQLCTKCHH